MSNELVRRIYTLANSLEPHSEPRREIPELLVEAADRIERLEMALQEIARTGDTTHDTWTLATVQSARARRALETQLDILAENIVGRTNSVL